MKPLLALILALGPLAPALSQAQSLCEGVTYEDDFGAIAETPRLRLPDGKLAYFEGLVESSVCRACGIGSSASHVAGARLTETPSLVVRVDAAGKVTKVYETSAGSPPVVYYRKVACIK